MTRSNCCKTAAIVAPLAALALLLCSLDSTPTSAETAPITHSEFPHVVHFESGAPSSPMATPSPLPKFTALPKPSSPATSIGSKAPHPRLARQSHVGRLHHRPRIERRVRKNHVPCRNYIDKGTGTFTLFLPMTCSGWPHISMYGDGQSFSGIYFGTGDSVLKQWWGQKPTGKVLLIDADGTHDSRCYGADRGLSSST